MGEFTRRIHRANRISRFEDPQWLVSLIRILSVFWGQLRREDRIVEMGPQEQAQVVVLSCGTSGRWLEVGADARTISCGDSLDQLEPRALAERPTTRLVRTKKTPLEDLPLQLLDVR